MRKSFLILGLLLLFNLNTLFGQTTSAMATTNVNAKLVVPMTLTEKSSLHFGTINVLGGEAGTVILPAGSTDRQFSGVVGSAVAPLASNAEYTVAGTKNVSYGVSLPGTISVTEVGGNDMTITDLKAIFSNTGLISTSSILANDGTDSFKVGGTLIVGVNQIPGSYTGTFSVSVDYN